MPELASFLIIEQLQPHTLSFLSASTRAGLLPRVGDSLLCMDVMPTCFIQHQLDIALKRVNVKPGLLQLDGRVGYLVLSSGSVSEVNSAGEALLSEMGISQDAINPPEYAGSYLVARMDAYQAAANNMMKLCSLCVPGESLYVIEVRPSSYTLKVCNEIEKEVNVKVIGGRITGSTGRLIVSGDDSEVRTAAEIAESLFHDSAGARE